MAQRKICIFRNGTQVSVKTQKLLKIKLESSGFSVLTKFSEDAELIVCIGGDGAFLQTVHELDFPHIPIIGINTGHLGFFQEIQPNQLDDFIFNYKQGKYGIQLLSTVKATATIGGKQIVHRGLNEIIIRGDMSYSIHLNISIGGSFIERFSGDGILVATPAGSTAYNYSLGGSIVDPRLNLLQLTPIAPMNTTAYRSFTSSILLPTNSSLGIVPEYTKNHGLQILVDGMQYSYGDIEHISIGLSTKEVKLLRFETYDFWSKVKSKFL
ncbi:MAG: NAD(+)/NADH kinase [Peptostreptococcaceae bacterium]|nr:NAD(+)/NADH kinase [Peptostreptococcaceae bacterium]